MQICIVPETPDTEAISKMVFIIFISPNKVFFLASPRLPVDPDDMNTLNDTLRALYNNCIRSITTHSIVSPKSL